MSVDLDGGNTPIALGTNYAIRAPGLTGTADLLGPRNVQAATRSATPAAAETAALDQVLAAQDMSERASIVLDNLRRDAAPAGGANLRAPSGDDALELQTPDFGADYEAVVLMKDESGAMSWHFPLAANNSIETAATRGGGKTRTFRIPRNPAPVPPSTGNANRGFLSGIGRKVLKVLVYPITDPIVGVAVDLIAGAWEKRNRPYALRTVTVDNYLQPLHKDSNGAGVKPLQADDAQTWQRLSAGRSVLFVHGTFSTIAGGFGGLPQQVVQELSTRYGGRMFGFDHPSLSHDPERNVQEFFNLVPSSARLDFDIVCHSRGGLVAREMDRALAAHSQCKIGNIVFVGVPNAGTVLADPNHMVNMLDRLTTALNFFPDGTITTVLEGIVTVVKVIGRGGLKSLDGLASMNPRGTYLERFASGSPSEARYIGVAADFEPKNTGFSTLALGDNVVDRIFGNKSNDLVVPTDGVSQAEAINFPLKTEQLLGLAKGAGVIHTTYFRHAPVQDWLLQWLKG